MTLIPARLAFLFGGAAFSVLDAVQSGPSSVQVTFSDAPQATDPSGTNDSLNPDNYSLSGSTLNAVQSVVYLGSDTVELTLYYPFQIGFWTVSVTNVKSGSGASLVNPKSWTFYVSSFLAAESPSLGAVNDSGFDILRKFMNPALKGPNWTDLLSALSVGEKFNYDNIRAAYDQLNICSASEGFLVQRASDQGISKPLGVGLSDTLFREYALTLRNERLTEKALLDIAEVFYGVDSIHANLVAGFNEPYDIANGADLDFLVDGLYSAKVIFDSSRFGIPHQAKALELAVQCNEYFDVQGVGAYAIGAKDPETGLTSLKVYSKGIGLRSSLECTGGKAQNQLHFDTFLDIYSGGMPDWVIDYDEASGETTFSTNDSNPNLSLLKVGDYANIFGSEFNSDNQGSYTILHVGYEYSIANPPVLTQSFTVSNLGLDESVTQLAASSIQFFRPHKAICNDVIVADGQDEVKIILPATSKAVSRTELTGSYLHEPTVLDVNWTSQGGLITLDIDTGLEAGNSLFLDSAKDFAVPATHTGGAGKTDYSYLSTWTSSSLTDGNRMGHTAVKLGSAVYIHGGEAPSTSTPPTYRGSGQKISYSVGTVIDTGVSYPQVTYANSAITQAENVSWAASVAGDASLQVYGYPTSTYLVFGGILSGTGVATNHFSYLDGTATIVSGDTLTEARAFAPISSFLNPGTYLISGGMGSAWQNATNTADIFDASAPGTFINTNPMAVPRSGHAQTKYSSTKFLASGGRPMALGPFVGPNTTALWRLDDSAATPADSGTNSFNLSGTSATLVTNSNANSKGAIQFDGLATKLTRVATAGIRTVLTSNAYTAQGWFRRTSTGSRPIFSYTGPSTPAVAADNILLGFGIDPGSIDQFIIYYDDATTARVNLTVNFTGLGGIPTTWNHWAITCTAGSVSGSKFALYINGRLMQTWDNQASPSGGANATLSIGYDPNGGYLTPYFQGYQSQIKLSDRVLSADEIWKSYLSGTGEAYWYKESFSLALIEERMGLAYNSCEIYDSDLDAWSATGSMTWTRWGHQSVLLGTGEVLVVGGYGYRPDKLVSGTYCQPVLDCEIWTPTTGRWRPAGKLQVGGFVSLEVFDDKILVYGGRGTVTDILDLKIMRWRSGLTPTFHFEGGAGVSMGDGVVGYFGGWSVFGIGDGTTENENFYVQNEDTFYSGTVNKRYTVVSSAPTTVLAGPAGFDSGSGTVMLFKTTPGAHPAGPFLFDPVKGWAPTAVSTTLTNKLAGSHSYPSIQVDDAASFTDGKYIVLGFGTSFATKPIKVLYKISDTELAIDASYVFPEDIETGASVIQVYSKDPYVPDTLVGQFLLTDSPAGRVAAQQAILDSVAGGNPINLQVKYPGDRGLGNEGYPTQGNYKLSDIVQVYAGSTDIDQEIQDERDRGSE